MSPRIKKAIRLSVVVGIVVFVGMQLVPVKGIGSNPTERYNMNPPPAVEAIMRRACFDCHTNETRWPLYARIAPGSWLMSRDVNKGRKHLNFSEWGSTDEDERNLDLQNCWDQVESGEMPPWFYIYPMHLHARLSQADKDTLKAWFLKDKDKK
jgi:Haem-binding domain